MSTYNFVYALQKSADGCNCCTRLLALMCVHVPVSISIFFLCVWDDNYVTKMLMTFQFYFSDLLYNKSFTNCSFLRSFLPSVFTKQWKPKQNSNFILNGNETNARFPSCSAFTPRKSIFIHTYIHTYIFIDL